MDASNDISVSGVYHLEHIRDGEIVQSIEKKNLIPDLALNAILNKMFNSSAGFYNQYINTSVYIPYVNDYVPNATATFAQFLTAAGELTFPGQTQRFAAGLELSNTTQLAPKQRSTAPVSITINTNTTIYGIAWVNSINGTSIATVGSTSNCLATSIMRLDTPLLIVSGDVLTVKYTLSFSST